MKNKWNKWNWHKMYHVGRDELAHARWKSRRLFAVVSLYFGVGETNCSQGKSYKDVDSFYKFGTFTCLRSSTIPRFFYSAFFKYHKPSFYTFAFSIGPRFTRLCFTSLVHSFPVQSIPTSPVISQWRHLTSSSTKRNLLSTDSFCDMYPVVIS